MVSDSDSGFDDLCRHYEEIVPDIGSDDLRALLDRGDLDEVVRYTAEHTPHTFARFWSLDPTPMMRLLGHETRVMTYMMGNNVVVERMYRHNPAVMLYAPLRTAIYEDAAGATHFSIDQPSTRFASFGDPRIAEVGLLLDAKVAELLALLGLPVPSELERQHHE
ncbi:hypothetical protein A5658_15855 [Mycobacterium sp. 1245111.1]|nr:hypothetical protein A5658_15855 [Mycobacterium sp. 1245111.1]